MSRPFPDDETRPRLYTVDEANTILPEITPTLIELRDLKEQLDAAKAELDRFSPAMRGNGHGADALALERQIGDLTARIVPGLQEIAARGIAIKDLNHGLIDFPSLRDGRIVYLCWRLGEDRVAFWHDIDAGFVGREPI